MSDKQFMTELKFESVGDDTAQAIWKPFLAQTMNMVGDIDSAVIIVSTKNAVKQVGFGDCLKVYGLLDFMKRQQWMRMAYPPGGRVKVVDKKEDENKDDVQ